MRTKTLLAATAISFAAVSAQAGGLLAPEVTDVPQAPAAAPAQTGSMGNLGVVGPIVGILAICALVCTQDSGGGT